MTKSTTIARRGDDTISGQELITELDGLCARIDTLTDLTQPEIHAEVRSLRVVVDRLILRSDGETRSRLQHMRGVMSEIISDAAA